MTAEDADKVFQNSKHKFSPLDSDQLGQVEELIREFRTLLSRTPVKVCELNIPVMYVAISFQVDIF
jgi:hypothetical protein